MDAPGGAPSGVPKAAAPLSRLLIVSDAWAPQVNGVVRTLAAVAGELTSMGRAAEVIGPGEFRTLPCPTYPEIRLALFPGRALARRIEDFAPEALHIATEGPLGMAARSYARHRGLAFTTSFHTRFPEYIAARTGLPPSLAYGWLRRFHAAGSGMMVAAESLRSELARRGFANIRPWTRGVDFSQFHTAPREEWNLPRPVFLYVGRVAVEKNIAAFLDLDLPGSKVVVGDGPQLAALRDAYPGVHFVGARRGATLAAAYAGGDVLVFPSRTDTFGLVLLEALACGTPVAAFPVPGPLDVLGKEAGRVGVLDEDLGRAARAALTLDRAECRAFAETFTWRRATEMFLSNLVPIRGSGDPSGSRALAWPRAG
ncbi:MAG TPA: glycosyltransferase family 1 protein [Acetobacteraceae bacterium]|nr:glycosyltransferase family 1 protein [Acetobacteraceae bacterium]